MRILFFLIKKDYFHCFISDCPDSKLLQDENRRILKAVEYVNLQRCDRMTMANSLEARVPFFDVDYIATAMKVFQQYSNTSSFFWLLHFESSLG